MKLPVKGHVRRRRMVRFGAPRVPLYDIGPLIESYWVESWRNGEQQLGPMLEMLGGGTC